ncbi:hypothetical protein DSCOOX_00800 [Desulfosarcina ovata subsp. ovata]|uniref:Uncharacterized protein n=1 Tax=Desulfosarcina ovata subsp. ovata TaxID=2752305 RepID=A0A5K8A3N0_9BACT|nr:hypothetical protein DSCOOX_00800 [Desulfosarcina ovata subsp. ovata]
MFAIIIKKVMDNTVNRVTTNIFFIKYLTSPIRPLKMPHFPNLLNISNEK